MLGLLLDVEAGQDHRHRAAVAAEHVQRDLQGVRGRAALRAGQRDPVPAGLLESQGVEVRDDIGIEVRGVADLVEQLSGDGADRHDPAGARVLGDDAAAVGGDLGDGEAGVAAFGDLVEEAVVAAGGLRAALDDVPGGDGAGQGLPVVAAPAVPPGGGADDQAGVGDPRADDDVGARLQRRRDAPPAEVGVRGDHRQVRLGQRQPGVEVSELVTRGPQVAESRGQVVAGEVGDPGGQAEPFGQFGDLGGQAGRVEPARVGHDLDAALQAGVEDLLHLAQERGGVAEARVLAAGLPQDEHGELGEVVAGQHVDRAGQHLPGRAEAVTVEPGAVRDADGPGLRHLMPPGTGRGTARGAARHPAAPRRLARSRSTGGRLGPRRPGRGRHGACAASPAGRSRGRGR